MAKQNFGNMLKANTKNKASDELRKIEAINTGDNFQVIPYDQIRPSADNKYPQSAIKEVEESIEKFGLFHNFVLIPIEEDNYKYKIVSGEQRYHAVGNLLNKGNKRYIAGVPAKILDKNTSETDRKIIQEEANIKQRNYDPQTTREAVGRLTELYKIKNKEENKDESVVKQVSEATGLGNRQVQRYNAVNTKLIDELKKEFDKANIPLERAAQFANMDQDTQKLVLELLDTNKNITKNEIEEIKKASDLKEEELKEKINELSEETNSYDLQKKELEAQIQEKENAIEESILKNRNIREEIVKELLENNPNNEKIEELEKLSNEIQDEKIQVEKEKEKLGTKLNDAQKELSKLRKELEVAKKNTNKPTDLSKEEKEKIKAEFEIRNIESEIKKGLNTLLVKSENYIKKYNDDNSIKDIYKELSNRMKKLEENIEGINK